MGHLCFTQPFGLLFLGLIFLVVQKWSLGGSHRFIAPEWLRSLRAPEPVTFRTSGSGVHFRGFPEGG